MKKIILFEINEIPNRILDYFCNKYPSSALAHVLKKSYRYDGVCHDSGHLSPWITWPTLHRGVKNEVHGIQSFNQPLEEADKEYPPVWQILGQAGVKTGVFSSLHTGQSVREDIKDYLFYVPDPFCSSEHCAPKRINVFQKFNLAMSRQSARNVSRQISLKPAVDVLFKSHDLGIKTLTYADICKHLVSEFVAPHKKVRRRTYQSVLAFDVFLKLLKETRPEFCTFFTNHVASAMHRYWAASFPEDYREYRVSKQWSEQYDDEIDFSLLKLDRMISKLVAFVDSEPEYTLVAVSSMGQAATSARLIDHQLYVKDLKAFMSGLGFESSDWKELPAMVPQVNVQIPSESKADIFETVLKTDLKIKDQPISYKRKDDGFFSLDFGQEDLSIGELEFRGARYPFESFGLEKMKIQDQATSTAYHVPEGSLFIYDPQNPNPHPQSGVEPVSTLAIVPNILKNYGLEVPSYMDYQPIKGFSF